MTNYNDPVWHSPQPLYTVPLSVRYYKGYKELPHWGHYICGHRIEGGSGRFARRDSSLRYDLKLREQGDSFVRLEAVNTTTLFYLRDEGGKLVKNHVLRFYRQPMPSAALSLELQVHLAFCNEAEKWPHVICDSHEERMRLGEYLGAQGFIELDGKKHGIFGLELVDRTVVYDGEFAVRRSRVGSQLRHDRHVTKQVREKLIDKLWPAA